MLNPYKVLGVSNGTSKEDCKKAYRKLCKLHHPDNCNGDDTKFTEISKAWDLINSGKFDISRVAVKRKSLSHISLFKFSIS